MSEGQAIMIAANIEEYLAERSRFARYASFDYCFNYFRRFHDESRLEELVAPQHLQMSCLQLGFYLASWGMFRGRSPLLQRSVRHYAKVVDALVSADRNLWTLDVAHYDESAVKLVIGGARHLRSAFPHGTSDVLITKIMLGVFGCVPAFDRYFRIGFPAPAPTFSRTSLLRIRDFNERWEDLLQSHKIGTIDFDTGEPTDIEYTRAKIIDMVFFIEGLKQGLVTNSD